MRKTATLSVAFAFAMAMAVGAQTSGQSGTYGQSHSPKTVKLTGCLQSGTSSDTFMLTNVTGDLSGMSSKSGSEGEGTSGTSGMSSDTSKTVWLSGNDKAETQLKTHVGEKVEVTGSWDMSSRDSSMSGSGTAAGQSGTSGTSGQSGMSGQSGQSGQSTTEAGMSGPRFKVASIRRISGTCTPQ